MPLLAGNWSVTQVPTYEVMVIVDRVLAFCLGLQFVMFCGCVYMGFPHLQARGKCPDGFVATCSDDKVTVCSPPSMAYYEPHTYEIHPQAQSAALVILPLMSMTLALWSILNRYYSGARCLVVHLPPEEGESHV